MKKTVCFAVLALVVGGTLFSQTWSDISNDGVMNIHRIITKEEYNRLKQQYEARWTNAMLQFVDITESSWPRQYLQQDGYYYVQSKFRDNADNIRYALVYGHTGRGAYSITFYNPLIREDRNDYIGSAEYRRKVSLYTGWVEGR
jgi:hypothetical protein